MVPPELHFRAYGCEFVVYNFPRAGDEVPMHAHEGEHLSFILAGKIRATDGKNHYDLAPTHMLTMHPKQQHGFVALEDNSVLLNVFRIGNSNGSSNNPK